MPANPSNPTPVPNKERIRLLVEALRSGNYAQGQGYLNSNGKFCCLGVACEVAIANGLDLTRIPLPGSLVPVEGDTVGYLPDPTSPAYKAESKVLPPTVVEWYGFSAIDPELDQPHYSLLEDEDEIVDETMPATELNDGLRLSLNKIADWFEATYLTEEPETTTK